MQKAQSESALLLGRRRFSKHSLLLLASTALFVMLVVGVVGRQKIADYCARIGDNAGFGARGSKSRSGRVWG